MYQPYMHERHHLATITQWRRPSSRWSGGGGVARTRLCRPCKGIREQTTSLEIGNAMTGLRLGAYGTHRRATDPDR